jgi:peptidoglycan/xylan/chitin deacetylase (PgdA/CDA1 family)
MKAIMYHYVREFDAEMPYFRNLHVDDFHEQLDYFEQKYGFVSQKDFLHSLQYPNEMPNGVVLTFDDGLKDHYRYVLPALQARNLWGIFYIPTAMYHTNKMLDVHRIHVLLGKFGGEKIFTTLKEIISDEMLSHGHITEFKSITYQRQKNDEYTTSVKRILNYLISYDYRETVLDTLMAKLIPNEAKLLADFYLTPSEMKTMQEAKMIIGSHTVFHPVMSKLSAEQQKSEIVDSFSYLETVTNGLPIKTFCYPYGGWHSFSETTEQLLTDNNCLFSFNVEAKDIDTAAIKQHRQALPRYDCNQFPHGQCRAF